MILDKLIIHLKNVLFFKAVIYVFAMIGLVILTPVVSEELKKATKKMYFAKSFLKQANVKLSSLSDFENKLEETNEKYFALKNGTTEASWVKHTKIVTEINKFLQTTDHIDDFLVKLNKLADKSEMEEFQRDVYDMNDILEIKNYRGIISFKTDNPQSFYEISSNISKLLPKNTIITAVTLQKIQTLSPDLIEKLSRNKQLMRFDARIEFLLREIEYSS